MRCFNELIRESELIDPALKNATFTCSNMQVSLVCKRLDRFVVLKGGRSKFPSKYLRSAS